MWNAETIKKLDNWYESVQGAFALEAEHKLFQKHISVWPRRGHTLLDIGCGSGRFLKMFWDYGFDVTGVDTNPEAIAISAERLGSRATFQQASLDDLPFENDSFNYISIIMALEYTSNPKAILTEAFRVASDGIIVGFINKWSLNYIIKNLFKRKKEKSVTHALTTSKIKRMAKQIYPSSNISTLSTLLLPILTWNHKSFFSKINHITFSLPIGSYVSLRIDKHQLPVLTPLILKAKEQAMAVCNTLNPEPTSIQRKSLQTKKT